MTDTVDTFEISLGVPRRVAECRTVKRRVQCKEGDRWVIPEELVLQRWRRKKTRPGVVFRGVRLPPGTWRAIVRCLDEAGCLQQPSAPSIRRALERLPAIVEDGRLRTPNVGLLRMMLEYLLKRGQLEPLLSRHRLVDPGRPGIPDLFLFRVEADGTVAGGRFVEVKRHAERLYKWQAAELQFLRSIGAKAGVVRLLKPAKVVEGPAAVA